MSNLLKPNTQRTLKRIFVLSCILMVATCAHLPWSQAYDIEAETPEGREASVQRTIKDVTASSSDLDETFDEAD